MATEQSLWASAKNFFSIAHRKIAPKLQEGDQQEVASKLILDKKRCKPAKLVNADNTYLYDFGSLNLP